DLLKEIAPKRDVMRQAGENAMDEIYISWSDSVKVAVERYSEIIEAGKPVRKFMARPRESMSEIMQELKEGLITENNRLRSLTQNVYAGMLSNSNSSLDDRESAGVTMRELIKDKLGL
ncbi:MAG: hypothetical protein K6E33_09480, partial [Lachnospiraceae bacterium]|nr:hypothetical protein [Lachnospiraceae bacterium]